MVLGIIAHYYNYSQIKHVLFVSETQISVFSCSASPEGTDYSLLLSSKTDLISSYGLLKKLNFDPFRGR